MNNERQEKENTKYEANELIVATMGSFGAEMGAMICCTSASTIRA